MIVIALAAVIYLGTPRSFSIRRGRGGGRNLIGVGWVLALVLTFTLPRTLTDATAKAIGQPHRAVVTQVEVNRSRSGGVSRNYALLVDDGERLPLGTVDDSDVGTLAVGDTTTVYVDPHHLVKPEVTTNLGREAILALLALIGLVGLNVGATRSRMQKSSPSR